MMYMGKAERANIGEALRKNFLSLTTKSTHSINEYFATKFAENDGLVHFFPDEIKSFETLRNPRQSRIILTDIFKNSNDRYEKPLLCNRTKSPDYPSKK